MLNKMGTLVFHFPSTATFTLCILPNISSGLVDANSYLAQIWSLCCKASYSVTACLAGKRHIVLEVAKIKTMYWNYYRCNPLFLEVEPNLEIPFLWDRANLWHLDKAPAELSSNYPSANEHTGNIGTHAVCIMAFCNPNPPTEWKTLSLIKRPALPLGALGEGFSAT